MKSIRCWCGEVPYVIAQHPWKMRVICSDKNHRELHTPYSRSYELAVLRWNILQIGLRIKHWIGGRK